METNGDPQRAVLYRRVLGGDHGAAQVWFAQTVLDRYRALNGFRVIRTDSAGRVSAPAGWSVDFGIADQDRLIHVSLTDLTQRLPAAEHQHWIAHLVTPPVCRTFIVMRLGAGSCIDDGEVRSW